MTYKIGYKGNAGAAASPSPAIWADCPITEILADPGRGIFYHDDFENYPTTATTVPNSSGLPTFEGDCTITPVSGGVMLFSTTDNEEASLAPYGAKRAPFTIPASAATGKQLWFECRVKKEVITANIAGFFVGLTSLAAGVADFINDAGADFANVDLLGFWNKEGEALMDVITQKTGAAFDTIADGQITLVADTFIKLGFVYNPDANPKERIKFYVDGVEQAYYVGAASGDQTVYTEDTTNFPGGELLAPLIAIKSASATDCDFTLNWWRCAQLR